MLCPSNNYGTLLFLMSHLHKCKKDCTYVCLHDTSEIKCARERAEPRVRSTQVLWIQDLRGKFLGLDLGPYDSLEFNWKGKSKVSNYPEGNELICTDMYERKRMAFH